LAVARVARIRGAGLAVVAGDKVVIAVTGCGIAAIRRAGIGIVAGLGGAYASTALAGVVFRAQVAVVAGASRVRGIDAQARRVIAGIVGARILVVAAADAFLLASGAAAVAVNIVGIVAAFARFFDAIAAPAALAEGVENAAQVGARAIQVRAGIRGMGRKITVGWRIAAASRKVEATPFRQMIVVPVDHPACGRAVFLGAAADIVADALSQVRFNVACRRGWVSPQDDRK